MDLNNLIVLEHFGGYSLFVKRFSEETIEGLTIDKENEKWDYLKYKGNLVGKNRGDIGKVTGVIGVYDLTNLTHLCSMVDIAVTLGVREGSLDDRF
ncbi:MAG: hypothetical protein NUV46_04625 [Nanoarchaeota archaeon]|nr:hypothetical protein [Nanoarchaeota archaeon]